MKNRKINLKNLSIRWKLFIYIALFAVGMVFVIWLFQVVFLSAFYRQSKIDELTALSKTIAENLDNQDLDTLITEVAGRNNICAMILDTSGNVLINVDTAPGCALHRLGSTELTALYAKAIKHGGSTMTDFADRSSLKMLNIEGDDVKISSVIPERTIDKNENIIYTQVVTEDSGNQSIIMLNTQISPVNATVTTLRSQLVDITIIFIVMAAILAIVLSRKISRPIVQINASAKHLGKGEVDVTFEGRGYREITELSDTLNYASTELSKVEHLRRELIANVSHDLRTPLTMITGYAEVMRDIPGENTPENVQIIIDEANRLAMLVNDMLDLSKIQSGTQELTLSVYNLTESIRDIMKRYTKLTEQDGYQITFEAAEDVYVEADMVRMTQVVYNLVNNAINYAGDDKVVIIRQTIVEGKVRIDVVDHGHGIAKDQLPYVWDRYYKIDKHHRQASVGTGLGLSIVKNIFEMHHMRYGVESTPESGSDFWFEMPIAKPKEN